MLAYTGRAPPGPEYQYLLPVRNGIRELRRGADSLLGQTYQAFEIIAINDGSTDGADEVLDEYSRVQMVAFKYSTNRALG